jgi:hypothetical protein
MSAGRRGVILSVAFLGLALWLCPAKRALAQQPMRAQPNDPGPGRHKIWKQDLTPDQIRDLLGRFGQDDGKGDPFEDLLRRALRDKNPNASKEQVDAAAKQFMNDKEFRDRVIDLAQRQKNRMGDNMKGGQQPQLSREDLAKLVKVLPDGDNNEPFKLPDEPNNPPVDPQRLPKLDPNNRPKLDPRNPPKFPLNEKGQPFDPQTGKPIDPNNPPKFDPPDRQINPPDRPVNPPQPPPFDPNAIRPNEAPNNDGKRRFDPENPLGPPNEPPDKAAKSKAVETATALWEKNVGPIDDSPAVKRAIIDLVSDTDAMDALTDGKGRNIFEAMDGENEDKFGNLFGNGGGDSGWEWPKFEFPWSRGRDLDLDVGSGRTRPPEPLSRDTSSRGPSSLDFGSFDFGGLRVPWLLLLLLMALAVVAVVWWKYGKTIRPRAAGASPVGPRPWPIDPREINSREDVVQAFEYLSVMICGPGAKMWTHSTIADELAELAQTHGEAAVKLARLYELARYAPLDEPLTRVELMEARRLVCDLAGVDEV